jgi:hypothetical protein
MRKLTSASPATYCIKLQGSLDASWSDTLGGMSVVMKPDDAGRPVTTLAGQVADQAMLLGVLNYVYDLGLPLLLVQLTDTDLGGKAVDQ